MLSDKLGHRLDTYFFPLFQKIFGKRGNPNLLTLFGFFSTLIASWLILKECWVGAGLMIVLSGLFDLMDGVIARSLGKVSLFGGFFDSVVDRYSDLILLFALLLHYSRKGENVGVLLTSSVVIGTALIPYVRAKAESIGLSCHIGLMERAERIILLAAATLFGWIEPILWILAILTHFTVLHRIYHVWKKLHKNNE